MKKIGIIEDSSCEKAKLFLEKLIEESTTEINCQIITIPPKSYPENLNIIILNTITPEESLERKLLGIKENGILILNCDDKNIPVLRLKKPLGLITCGFNTKSSFTASSVSHGDFTEVQCCIQRGFYTEQGEYIEPQEFSVQSEDRDLDVIMILACVAAALMVGVKSSDIFHKTKLSL